MGNSVAVLVSRSPGQSTEAANDNDRDLYRDVNLRASLSWHTASMLATILDWVGQGKERLKTTNELDKLAPII